jgi:DNA-binding response OmpR family regulator
MEGPMNASSGDRVLVVEEPDGRDMLQLGLEMAGYKVDVVDDGEAGLIVAAARPPAAAIIDLSVPIIDGWSLAESLRYVFGQQIRLIAVTSRDEPEERERSRAAGFDTHLVKPVSPNRVYQTLRRLLATETRRGRSGTSGAIARPRPPPPKETRKRICPYCLSVAVMAVGRIFADNIGIIRSEYRCGGCTKEFWLLRGG